MSMKSSIDDIYEVGALIRNLRKKRHLTQQELADQAGVSFSFINQVERGKKTVRLDALNKLLLVFDYKMAPVRLQRSEESIRD